ALGERSIPEGQSLFQAITSTEPSSRHPDPVAEWFEPAGAKPLLEGEASPTFANGVERRQGILRVHAAEDSRTRRDVEEVIDAHAKRWVFESDDRGADGLPTLTYKIHLKKRYDPGQLLRALQEQLGPRLAETAPTNGAPDDLMVR
ncbi:MAG: hypothetical protein ACAI18_10580, partial [Gemmatimonadales bacterium]